MRGAVLRRAMGLLKIGLILFFVIAGLGTGLIIGGYLSSNAAVMSWGIVIAFISIVPLLGSAFSSSDG
ncbi:MAG: hypothetical protein NZ988_00295 [Thaumarchaeota archaeon]|nr:hypothetical protein [Candidatus Calditenuaceae archaeon]MDW8186479.1 hypothetical protein [Nitrososphaerota archaeon]